MDESEAFIAWLGTYNLPTRSVATLADLSDGVPLFDVLSIIDDNYFKHPSRAASQLAENWVLRLASLKRLFRLITQYFVDALNQPSSSLDVPDLQAIARDHDALHTMAVCRLVLAIAVQSEGKQEVVEHIKKLSERHQSALMRSIEEGLRKYPPQPKHEGDLPMTEDDHFYQIQSDRSRALAEKETLENVYKTLIADHQALQANYDDAMSEKSEAIARLKEAERRNESHRNDKADAMMRAEIDRLRLEISKSEDNLGAAEAEVEKQTNRNAELTRKLEDLQVQANLAAKLKDQVDEYKHSAEKVQKMENVMEKYKKKLEESAELRRLVKTLEDQNASLVDKNASLEEEFKKVSSFRPLMDSYKSSITDLEGKVASRTKEVETLKYQLEQAQAKLAIIIQERTADTEALELYQERVRELELAVDPSRVRTSSHFKTPSSNSVSPTVANGPVVSLNSSGNLDEELDDATSGRTWTDMKLEIRALKRQIADLKSNSADAGRVQVLETLFEDAKRSKARYEEDYLLVHREKLVLQAHLDEVRSGKSSGDGAEAAIALRQRLNEVVEQLDTLRVEHNQLSVQHEAQSRALTIAKSDLNLVNKDQLDILATLRESVNEDKFGLEAEVKKLHTQVQDLKERNKMHLEQVNTLLMEKVNLQSDGMTQREKMLERERTFADLRASVGGKDLPEDIKARLTALHEENNLLKEKNRTDKQILAKARSLVKEQDEMIQAMKTAAPSGSNFQEAEAMFQAQIKALEEALASQKRKELDLRKIYSREQALILSVLHNHGMERIRVHQANHRKPNGGSLPPSSWLKANREKANTSLR